jgi:hypothetical protein
MVGVAPKRPYVIRNRSRGQRKLLRILMGRLREIGGPHARNHVARCGLVRLIMYHDCCGGKPSRRKLSVSW